MAWTAGNWASASSTRASRSAATRGWAASPAWAPALGLPVRPLDLLARLPQTRLQRLASAKRAGAGTAADARAILRDARQRHNPPMQQDRDRLRQQIVERRLMRHAEITQRVVIHRHAAAQPAIRVVGVAQAVDFARAPHAIDRRVEPERDQNLRIDGRRAGPPSRALIFA